MMLFSNITRNPGDPKVIRPGPSSLEPSDRVARGLGWFSYALGAVELLAPRRVTRALGMEGYEPLIRTYGARELGAGFLSLSIERRVGLWSRVAGDGLDLATLLAMRDRAGSKRDNVTIALAVVGVITALDLWTALANTRAHARTSNSRGRAPGRAMYRDRSGYPRGIERARGVARGYRDPRDRARPGSIVFEDAGETAPQML